MVFSAQVEADIFRNLAANLSSYKHKLTVPAMLIYGEQTEVCPHSFFKKFVKLNKQLKLETTHGGHMFPLERPEATAHLIAKTIANL